MYFAQIVWLVVTLVAWPLEAPAGAPVQADLSISVVVTPANFTPGSQGTISLTLQNHGPDTAGSGAFPNLVFQRGFRLEVPTDRPPYEIRDPVTGCFVATEIVGPFSDLSFGLVWSFYFDVIAPGMSRTCTFPIEFYPQPFESFDTFWVTALSTEDPNPANNRVDYRFVAGTPYAAPTPVPTVGWPGLVALLIGLGWLGLRHQHAARRGCKPALPQPAAAGRA